MDIRVAFFLLSSRPSASWDCRCLCRNICAPLAVVVSAAIIYLGSKLCARSLALSLLSLPPPFLRPPTFSLLPSSSSLAAPPPPSLNAQKGYDIILEWALRYIALFPPSFLSISPSAALLLPLGDVLTDDWGTTFVHYTTSSSFSLTLS